MNIFALFYQTPLSLFELSAFFQVQLTHTTLNHMKHIFRLIFITFLFSYQSTGAQNSLTYEMLFKTADSIMSEDYSGVILISLPDGKSKIFTGGKTNQSTENAIDENDAFNLLSLGKSLTAATIIKLIQEGKLKPDDPIAKYLPERNIPNQEHITIRHLLGHSSGLGDYMTAESFKKLSPQEISHSRLLSIIEKQPAQKAPGESFVYSNSGYIILGAVIEAIENHDYKKVLTQKILNPAGIENVYFSPGNRDVKYYNDSCTQLNDDFPKAMADGGIWMKANDLLKFINFLYSNGFSEDSRNLLFNRITKFPERGNRKNPGLGASFLVYEYPAEVRVIGNNGGFKGSSYSSFRILYQNPDNRLTIVVFSNREGMTGPAISILEAKGKNSFN